MQKNICYFVGTHGDWGGAGRILFNLIRRLNRKRFEPIVMLSKEGPIGKELKERNIDHHIWEKHDLHNPLKYFLDVIQCLRFYRKQKIDLIHLNYACIGWKPAELLAARILNIPVINHFQNIENRPSSYLKYSKLVVTCSNFVAQKSETFSVPKKVIYDIVNADRFGNGRDIRKELRLEENDLVISFIGRTRKIKGLEMFIDLSKNIPDKNVKFLITGQRVGKQTPDSYSMEEIDELVSQDERIKYLGYREDIENIYATSDFIIMPSQGEEPCPAVLLEASASRKTVIATNTGSTSEFIIHGENGFLVGKHDIDSMTKYTEMLINDKSLRQKMGKRAREIVEERFTDKPVRDIETIYEELIRV